MLRFATAEEAPTVVTTAAKSSSNGDLTELVPLEHSSPVPQQAEKWPDAVAYQEAIQHPSLNLDDPMFYGATVAQNRRGLPLAYTGRFAVVFRLTTKEGTVWALRCFTSAPGGTDLLSLRYAALESRLNAPELADLFVPFRYLPDGIRVGQTCYPALAMGWADGEPLGKFVEKNKANPAALLALAASLSDTLARLEAAGIAHGDWQHDNILIADNGRRVTFVDYDGMYVSELAGMPPGERGHPNYQHPGRHADENKKAHEFIVADTVYGPHLDRFPCLLIQTALTALALEPSLFDSYFDGDALLFHKSDLEDPARSDAFAAARFVAEQERELAAMVRALEESCWTGVTPVAVPRAIFDTILARRGFSLTTLPNKATAPTTPATLTTAEDEKLNAPLVTVGKEGEETELAMTAGGRWFQLLRSALRRQTVREVLHRTGTWAFYAGALAAWVAPDMVAGGGFDVFSVRFMEFFFVPAGTAVAYFLWPRNLDGIAVTEAIGQNTVQLNENFEELRQVRNTLFEINRNPANLSAVAFVAATLKNVPLNGPVREKINLSSEEWAEIARRNLVTLGDISTQSVAGMSGAAREQLLSVRQEGMQFARDAYEELSLQRRTLQRESDQLEQDRQGLTAMHDELRVRLLRLGDENFPQFVAHLFGR